MAAEGDPGGGLPHSFYRFYADFFQKRTFAGESSDRFCLISVSGLLPV